MQSQEQQNYTQKMGPFHIDRRGRAKRPANYEDLASIEAQAVHHAAEITGLLARAGAAIGLYDGARLTLVTLVELTHTQLWRDEKPILWASNPMIAEARGIDVRSVQRHLAHLEAEGWLIRRYTQQHQRAGKGGIDLAPLTHRLHELRSAIAEAQEARLARRYEDIETASIEKKPSRDDTDGALNTVTKIRISLKRVPASRKEVAPDVVDNSGSTSSGPEPRTITPPPPRHEQAVSLIRSALAAAEADPDQYLYLYETGTEGELATAVAALAKRKGVAASWIDAAYPRYGRLGVAARLTAAMTLPGAKSVPGLARWMLSTTNSVDPWASIYARARS
jgi:hypothetical protein